MNDDSEYGHYSMTLEWDPVDEIYVVTVPELPGCNTHGRTLEEAVQQGRDAIETWIDGRRYWGHPIPPPKYFVPEEEEIHALA
jgi:predicted RNase H-like HicB family nuclease